MMPKANMTAKTLISLLAFVSSASVVHFAISADDDAKPAEPSAVSQTTAEKQIWALEQAYWENNRDAKHEQIIAAWHDKFLGWPDGEPKPIDKEEGTRYVRENYPRPASYCFDIEPTGICMVENVAVNHYAVHLKWEDGRKRTLRITHTWVRHNAGWKVLGGMSDSQ